MLDKPDSVASDPVKSAQGDEVTACRGFNQADAPALALLSQWHKVAQQASEELESFGVGTAYQTDMGDLKPFPQIATLKAASAEIRALNRQLGLAGEAAPAPEPKPKDARENVLELVMTKRAGARRSG